MTAYTWALFAYKFRVVAGTYSKKYPNKCIVQNFSNFAFGRKVDFLSIRNWLLKVFLLDSNGGYFDNYIHDLSKIIIYLNGMNGINMLCNPMLYTIVLRRVH